MLKFENYTQFFYFTRDLPQEFQNERKRAKKHVTLLAISENNFNIKKEDYTIIYEGKI